MKVDTGKWKCIGFIWNKNMKDKSRGFLDSIEGVF
jgi:hypothetical protein